MKNMYKNICLIKILIIPLDYEKIYRHTGIQAYRHTGIQAYRHTGIQAYRHTGIQAVCMYAMIISLIFTCLHSL
jgi:hypothetical protein